ncbi:hypothetical protein FQN50_004895 [Emmonsiellopsis sp. PD_5]|nr:hypothetical protein FQN50_004895 [Emmonsiellopsis sp. PD_5]
MAFYEFGGVQERMFINIYGLMKMNCWQFMQIEIIADLLLCVLPPLSQRRFMQPTAASQARERQNVTTDTSSEVKFFRRGSISSLDASLLALAGKEQTMIRRAHRLARRNQEDPSPTLLWLGCEYGPFFASQCPADGKELYLSHASFNDDYKKYLRGEKGTKTPNRNNFLRIRRRALTISAAQDSLILLDELTGVKDVKAIPASAVLSADHTATLFGLHYEEANPECMRGIPYDGALVDHAIIYFWTEMYLSEALV